MAYSFVVAFVIAFAIKKTMGIRMSPEDEESGHRRRSSTANRRTSCSRYDERLREESTALRPGPGRRDPAPAGVSRRAIVFPSVIL